MIHLFENDRYTEHRASSKGNQLKFRRGDFWYKADFTGYEGLAEYTVSKLLVYSDLSQEEYVDYDLEEIEYNGNVYPACKSRDFAEGWQMYTLERLFEQNFGIGLNKMIYTTPDHRERLRLLVDQVERLLAEKPAGSKLAFVGDGINDAPVLSRADIGIAMGAMGSDAAIEAADVVLMDDNPERIALAMQISRKCLRIVHENIYFALGVKGLCLILGALGIANMWVAVFADVGVMILAVCNAIRCLSVRE